MSRLVFKKGCQKRFIEQVKRRSKLNWQALSKVAGVSGRTLRDWRREKFLGSNKVLSQLSRFFRIKLPKILEIRDEYWSIPKAARKGGIARTKIYGPPGTPEGRRKGGLISQQRRRENPRKYKSFRKKIRYPPFSSRLAEAFGIILGDGGITTNQVFISLNVIADKRYSPFVKKLFKELFRIKVKQYKRKDNNTLILGMNGVNLVEFLINKGLLIGDKVKQQVNVPKWIVENPLYRKACLRGLMDTDGGIFNHRYNVNGKKYNYRKICFVNRSIPILYFVKEELKNLGLNPKIQDNKRVWVYNKEGVKKYLELIGSHNPRLIKTKR